MSAASTDQVPADDGTAAQNSDPERDSSNASTDEPTTPTEELPLDQIFEILKNKRRREVLHYLRESEDSEVTLGEVAEHIAAIENDTTVDAISSSERKRVYVGLYQCHLPKMDDMNIVDFNQNRGRIELAENATQLEPYLERDEGDTRPWHQYYAASALGAGALYGLALVSGISSGLTSPLLLAGLVVAVGAIALAQHLAVRDADEE